MNNDSLTNTTQFYSSIKAFSPGRVHTKETTDRMLLKVEFKSTSLPLKVKTENVKDTVFKIPIVCADILLTHKLVPWDVSRREMQLHYRKRAKKKRYKDNTGSID